MGAVSQWSQKELEVNCMKVATILGECKKPFLTVLWLMRSSHNRVKRRNLAKMTNKSLNCSMPCTYHIYHKCALSINRLLKTGSGAPRHQTSRNPPVVENRRKNHSNTYAPSPLHVCSTGLRGVNQIAHWKDLPVVWKYEVRLHCTIISYPELKRSNEYFKICKEPWKSQ